MPGQKTPTASFTDVNQLPVVSPAIAAQILAAVMEGGKAALPADELGLTEPAITIKPGVERWPVKTGQDAGTGNVAGNVINGKHLGVGIVPATVEQLVRIPRPPDMNPATQLFPAFQAKRSEPVELIVWQLEGNIIFLKLESDGDYHLVLQGASGDTLIVEVPNPTPPFIGSSPWFANIKEARAQVDSKLVSPLSPADFVLLGNFLVPRQAVPMSLPHLELNVPKSFCTLLEETNQTPVPLFKTAIHSTPARITGVGFFDLIHGQTGVSLLNGIELHPVLKIEWL